MEDITIQIPEELSRALEPYREHLDEVLRIGLREFKMAQALGLYQKGGLSLWKAARMAEVSFKEMARYAAAQGLRPPSDEEMLKEELA
jgi:predicted HTH domain antitoxin